ncbi:uncharacterized protein LOC111246994 isoform X1 [Varroa destructor]|uniref:Uncharacterized protein n=2 Tax=Varroa destructor TaxID=109461 RepID=A0A7M7JK85_VARDE|nr:uncharacterized protein LOC111246994 isoform X1 [Varroa destructor]
MRKKQWSMRSCVVREGAVRDQLVMSSSASFSIKSFLLSAKLQLQLSLMVIFALSLSHATPTVPLTDFIASDRGDELRFSPSRWAYRFGSDSHEMVCEYRPRTPARLNTWLQLSNVYVEGLLSYTKVDSLSGASIRFQVRNITSSSEFSCRVYSSSSLRYIQEKQAQVFVLVDRPESCHTDKQCWGYGRNVVCDNGASQRCMCAIKAARTSQDSPICTELIPVDKCKYPKCRGDEDDCICTRDPAIVLNPASYKHKNPSNFTPDQDEVAILNGSKVVELSYLVRSSEECIHCYRTSSNLQYLQAGLFLVGAVLAFTAVTLMAVVIRKMWLYYRVPPYLLEASHDLERETIEREAEQMAQRDKPPSYIEVMEGDLRISGYPPPDYEEFASAVRQHRDVERRQPHRRICNTGELQLSSDRVGRRHNNVPNPMSSGRRSLVTPWCRAFQLSGPAGSQGAVRLGLGSPGTVSRLSLATVSSISGTVASSSHLEVPSYEESAHRLYY